MTSKLRAAYFPVVAAPKVPSATSYLTGSHPQSPETLAHASGAAKGARSMAVASKKIPPRTRSGSKPPSFRSPTRRASSNSPAALNDKGHTAVSTGGTHKALADAGLSVSGRLGADGFRKSWTGASRRFTGRPGESLANPDDAEHADAMSAARHHRDRSRRHQSLSLRRRPRKGGDYPTTGRGISISAGPAMIRASARTMPM